MTPSEGRLTGKMAFAPHCVHLSCTFSVHNPVTLYKITGAKAAYGEKGKQSQEDEAGQAPSPVPRDLTSSLTQDSRTREGGAEGEALSTRRGVPVWDGRNPPGVGGGYSYMTP